MQQPTEQLEYGSKNIDFTWGVKIPLRDGVSLNATLYKPKVDGQVPAIFTLTPYISDSYHPLAYYFAQNGYAFVLVDCRGRGNSEGTFESMMNEGPDGYDVVEWLAAQPWCTGSVGMWGGSYAGFDQWMAVKEFPPHLKTIVPAAAAHAGVDFPFLQNIYFPYEIQWMTLTSGVTRNQNIFNEASFWIEKFRELFMHHLPFNQLDRIAGNTTTDFQTWLAHPTPGAYWDRLVLTPDEYARIDLPILTITGHYDDDQPGALQYYKEHMRYGNLHGCSRHYLVIGPWDHAGTRTPVREFGGLKVGEASLVDLNKLHKEWYGWTLMTGPRPDFLKKRVAYYVLGAEKWRYVDNLDELADQHKRLFLNSSQAGACDVFHSGTLEDNPPAGSMPDEYVYDPLDIRPATVEMEEIKTPFTDQRYALNLFGAGLVYHSKPFEEATEISGFVKLAAWIEMDVPDTDFWVRLSEILLDGSQILLTEDFLRARYRNSLREEQLVTPGEIYLYEFSGFRFFSKQIAVGSRLRLVIRAPNSIYLQKNYNSGGSVSAESGKDARTAHVRLYHDVEHPSYLELPVVTTSTND